MEICRHGGTTWKIDVSLSSSHFDSLHIASLLLDFFASLSVQQLLSSHLVVAEAALRILPPEFVENGALQQQKATTQYFRNMFCISFINISL